MGGGRFLMSEVPQYADVYATPKTFHQPSEREQIVFFEHPDVYHRSLDSSELQYKSRKCKRRIDPTVRTGGCVGGAALPVPSRKL